MTKRALCVGVDVYQSPSFPRLNGCTKDAQAVAKALTQFLGFASTDVKDLLDQRATKDNFMRSVDWLLMKSNPGDQVLLYFAGYGSHHLDASNDLSRGLDEILVLYDQNWQFNVMRDDELADKLQRLGTQVPAVVIFDSCPMSSLPGRYTPPPAELFQLHSAIANGAVLKPRFRNRSPQDLPGCLFLSSCGPNEAAIEIPSPERHGGAFTLCLLEALASAPPNATWEQLSLRTTEIMRSRGIFQTSQFHASPQMRNMPLSYGSNTSSYAATDGRSLQDSHNSPTGPISYGSAPGPISYGANPGPVAYGANPGPVAYGANPGPVAYGANPGPAPDAAPSFSPGFGTGAAVGAAGLVGAAGAAFAGVSSLFGPSKQSPAPMPPNQAPAPVAAPASLATTPLDQALCAFSQNDYTPRLCSALFGVLPFAPPLRPYHSLADAGLGLGLAPDILNRAAQIAVTEPVTKALWVFNAVDTADSGLAIFSGLKGAVNMFFSDKRMDALETDPQQAIDAGVKLLAMSYVIHKVFPGSIQDKVRSFHQLAAGQSLMIYYAAAEISLPFADNVLQAGGSFLSRLYQKYGTQISDKVSGVIGAQELQESQGIMGSLLGSMEGTIQKVVPFASKIADTARSYVPSALGVADKVAGVVATGADAMPVYRFLGARLLAEASLLQASQNG